MKYDETLIMQDIILFLYVCGTKVKSGSNVFEIIPVDYHSLNAFLVQSNIRKLHVHVKMIQVMSNLLMSIHCFCG